MSCMIDSDVAALQSFEPSPYRSKQQDEADKSNTATEETDDDFNNSLSLPLSDSLPKSKSVLMVYLPSLNQN